MVRKGRRIALIQSGLFFAGEIVDMGGFCCEYKLAWTWASGAVAGAASSSMGFRGLVF